VASPAVRAFKTDAWGRLGKAIALLSTLDPAFQVETRLDLPIGGVSFIGYVDRIGKAAGKDRRFLQAASVLDWKSP
jgi:hypothetical protein